QTAVDVVRRQIADAARLGATRAYVVPGLDASPAGLTRFTEACTLLADHAGQRMVKLCVEHIPGRALPTVASALEWLDRVRHHNLHLLLDTGHCSISSEDPGDSIRQAGPLLGQVHFDDNDGKGDLHWNLLTGVLSETALRKCLASLRQVGY